VAGKAGNLYAIDLSWRMRQGRGRRIAIDLPPVEDVAGLHKAQAMVIAMAAAGKTAPGAALAYSTMLEHRRRMIELADIEPRLEAIEEAIKARRLREGTKGRA
jgi:predicted amidohydrolase